MKATPFEYRFRLALFVLIDALGFLAPWNYALHLDPAGPNAHTWGTLSALLAKTGALSIGAAFNLLLALAIVFAALAAWLRIWGAAYLRPSVVQSASMQTTALVSAGPYRYLRNPLYLALFLHTLALAILMPPSGAIFTILTTLALELRLMFVEESFLTASLSQPYADYCAHTPRLIPALRSSVPASTATPHWRQAALAEIYMLAVAISFAVFGWRYNAFLLIKCVVISFGLSLVVRAAMPPKPNIS